MQFPLLVFDWDGTLMDSEARIVACVQAAAHDAGLPALDEARARNIIGLGLREAFDALFPDVHEAQHERLVAAYRHHFLGNSMIISDLFPGVSETLIALREQGYLLAVATGKGRQGLNHVLEQTGCTDLFHTSRCADETISKPHPQMLLEIMDELEMEPGR
ncbi:MAG: HAD hydrolase-like protein, partial [Gammaproteobacteria bacterium]